MASRERHALSRSFSSAVSGIWRKVGGAYPSSNVLQYKSYDEGLDGRPQPSASAAHPLSGEVSPVVPTTQKFGAQRPVYDRNSHPLKKSEGFRVYRPIVKLSRTALIQYNGYDERLDGHPPPSASAADPLSGEVSPVVPTTQKFGAQRPVYDRNSYPLKKSEGFRVYRPIVKLSRADLNEGKRPVRNRIRASRSVAPKSCQYSPGQGFGSGKDLSIISVCGRENLHLPSPYVRSEATTILKHRRQQGLSIDSYTFIEILKRCSMQKDLVATRQVHGYIIQSGMQKQRYVATLLLNVYIKCGSLHDARLAFDSLEKTDRTVITWTVMIGAYAKSGCGVEAYRLFLQMKQEGFEPNAITYMSILNASASAGALEWVKEVHRHALEAGLESDLGVGNALVHMYAKSGSLGDARLVFDRLKTRDVITWNEMIGAYAESGDGVEAYRLFLQMKQDGLVPDALTYVNILNPFASAGPMDWVKDVHSHALTAGLESDVRVGNVLVHMFARIGSIDDARLVFNRMEKRDAVTWNVMIGGLAQHGYGHEAVEHFRKMNADYVKPDATTFVAVLSGCCHGGLVDDGRRFFSAMTHDSGIEPTRVHYSCMVDLLGRAGHLEEAKLFIGGMPVEPNVVTWGALLSACKTYGNVEMGELAAKELLNLEPMHAGAYVLLSNIYAASGRWDKVSLVRTLMQERGVRKEPGRSWIEVDNKIHEFVVGDSSHPEAKAIYSELNKLTEQLKAKGYIPDTKLVLHDIDEEDKELALCSHSEKLAIAYGLLRVPHGKSILVKKNLRVCLDCHAASKLISEVTGREIIVRDWSRFHHFKTGVCSCGDYW